MPSFLFWLVFIALAAIVIYKMILVETKRLNRRYNEGSYIMKMCIPPELGPKFSCIFPQD